jgi:hypothetical protein
MNVWDDLEKRLDIVTQDGLVKKPRVEELDRYEQENGFKLPDDYREFALAFGPGGFGRLEWWFATPGFPKGHDLHDLAISRESWRRCRCDGIKDADLTKQFGIDADRVRRLVPFCNQRLDGEAFAWDISDVTDPERHEYGIYHITFDHPPMKRVASTFREFVLDYALGGGFERQSYAGNYYGGDRDMSGDLSQPGPIQFEQSSIPSDDD